MENPWALVIQGEGPGPGLRASWALSGHAHSSWQGPSTWAAKAGLARKGPMGKGSVQGRHTQCAGVGVAGPEGMGRHTTQTKQRKI